MTEGWICPKCGCVYAPWVAQCDRCSTGNAEYRWSTSTSPAIVPAMKHTGLDQQKKPVDKNAIDYDALFKGYAEPPDRMTLIHPVDPNTQCVDCQFGTPVKTPDGLGTSIRCELYGEMRSPKDTCKINVVDTSKMTTSKEKA